MKKASVFWAKSIFLMAFMLIPFLAGVTSCLAKEYKFGITQGWVEYESGKHNKQGYEDGLRDFGGKATFVSAQFNPQTQSGQIETFINAKVDAIFITPCDNIAVAPAVKRALDAGIPVFASDSLLTGASPTLTIMSNNFGLGVVTGDYIAKRLNGKGNVAAIKLPSNENWDSRVAGLKYALRSYPNIKLVYEYGITYESGVSPREAGELILTRFPKKGSLDAIWSAWDGGAMETALAIKSAGRQNEIFTVGIDGGLESYSYIKRTPMAATVTQDLWNMTYMAVYYAHQHLQGKKVPRVIITPSYLVTEDDLKQVKDLKALEYIDKPGVAKKFGFERKL